MTSSQPAICTVGLCMLCEVVTVYNVYDSDCIQCV